METETIQSNQYLTFTLDKEHFAVEIPKVREVLDYTTVTRVPRTPEFMRGVINLRGNVVPVLDLRLGLGMEAIEKTVDTCIVIVEVSVDSELLHLGMLADSVQEVVEIDSSQIEPAPRLGTRLRTEFILGMGKRDDGFVIILDIDKVLSTEDLALIQENAGQQLVSNAA
jgi:purine-binding chemotaxis protein CheW